MKEHEDSIAAIIKHISSEYNNADSKRKKELQDMLSARNQQVNNFRLANEKRMKDIKKEKMESVIQKINAYLK